MAGELSHGVRNGVGVSFAKDTEMLRLGWPNYLDRLQASGL